jgi:lysosomal acid lipase/cholesteryl ester hydrolase
LDPSEETSGTRPIVNLVDGEQSTGEGFMLHGPELSPAFYLYNQGYDVWLTNRRGDYYSRNHQTLNADTDSEFWEFGYEEMAIDHIATTEFILQATGRESLSIIALFSGGSTTIASASMNPEFYEQRVDVLIALVPDLSMQHTPSPLFQFLIATPAFFDLLRSFGIYEFGGYNFLQTQANILTCRLFPFICQINDQLMYISNPPSGNDPVAMANYRGHSNTDSSVRLFEQMAQTGRDGNFNYFNYGAEGNMELYGTEGPRAFPLDDITIPIALFQGN